MWSLSFDDNHQILTSHCHCLLKPTIPLETIQIQDSRSIGIDVLYTPKVPFRSFHSMSLPACSSDLHSPWWAPQVGLACNLLQVLLSMEKCYGEMVTRERWDEWRKLNRTDSFLSVLELFMVHLSWDQRSLGQIFGLDPAYGLEIYAWVQPIINI